MTENEIGTLVTKISYEIYQTLGPGLLESVYHRILAYELRKKQLEVLSEAPIPVIWKGKEIDQGFRADFETVFNDLVKEESQNYLYTHTDEGSDDMPAHIKSTLVGHNLTIPIMANKLQLGTWQGIYLCEFRNIGGPRNLIISLYS